ncbi:MAG TPA: right-handed parallel beta-helix repeat-containing protein [Glycomyces sp.]|nr:right-handed parallel beta-helix repeat-containing protein [Glycomyces sp.]
MARSERRLAAVVFTLLALVALGASGFIGSIVAESRTADQPVPEGHPLDEPPAYRENGPALLVCTDDAGDFAERNAEVNYNQRIENERTYEDCLAGGHRDLPAALAAVTEPGTRIQILPGSYTVEETILIDGANPAVADLQIEGLGDGPEDVLLSARFAADTVLEARGAERLYLKGLTFGQARESGLLLDDVTAGTVESVAAVQSGGHGLHLVDSHMVALTGCRAEAADTAGITVETSNATVEGCEASGNLAGILTVGNGDMSFRENRLHENTTGLAVTETGDEDSFAATGNLVYDNNTDDYDLLGTASCEADLAERDWSADFICPNRTFPSGVGILLTDANHVSVTENRIWNQQLAAIAAWGSAGLDGGGDRNRFIGNVFGERDDGQHQRNRLDVWWDGVGTGNCFKEPNAFRTSPAALPGCEAAIDASRLYGDPLKALKTWQCGITDASAGVPDGCDWLGAQFTDRLEFQAAVVFAAALLFLTGAGWLGAARAPDPPRAGRMTFSAMATGAGGLLLVLAVWSGRADYEALAIGLWGFGWILAGRSWHSCGVRVFGAFTGLIGVIAVLDALDRAVQTLAPMPIAPAWIWLALLPLWTLFALSAAFGPRAREEEPPRIDRTPVTAPAHERFDW